MTLKSPKVARGSALAGIALALATGGMAMKPANEPTRMANLKVASLSGYEVLDLSGDRVGEIAGIDTDAEGRTRWLHVALDAGGEAKVASFRADLDMERRRVTLRLSEDLLVARAEDRAI